MSEIEELRRENSRLQRHIEHLQDQLAASDSAAHGNAVAFLRLRDQVPSIVRDHVIREKAAITSQGTAKRSAAADRRARQARRMKANGATVASIAETLKVTQRTVYNLLKRP